MDELEHQLQRARLAGPSGGLDRRIADAVAAARSRRRASRRVAVWCWTTGLAAAAGVATLLVVFPHRSFPAPEVKVYRLEAQGRLREMLVNPAPTHVAEPPFIFHVNPS